MKTMIKTKRRTKCVCSVRKFEVYAPNELGATDTGACGHEREAVDKRERRLWG